MAERETRTVKGYQEVVFNSLKSIFGEHNVEKEWNVAKDSRDDFTREFYCPRLDIAVGPFHIDGNNDYSDRRMGREISLHRIFINNLFDCSENPTGSFEEFVDKRNENPRCFLAVEIENSGYSKHMLGNIANVSIIGSIGIVIPFNEDKISLCKRIKKYVTFATEVEKIKDVFKNVLIIRKEKFLEVLNEQGMSN